MLLYSSCEEGVKASKIYTNFMRKNLMVIEMLKNFAIEENSPIVDIDKMRKLLPKTMNIEKRHLKMLVFSNIHILNQAMNKLRDSKNSFIQYQLVNKIISTAQKIDRDIDSDIFKIQLKKNVEEKKNSKSKYDYYFDKIRPHTSSSNHSQENYQCMTQYSKIIEKMKQNVVEIKESKKNYHNNVPSVRGSMSSWEIKSSRNTSPQINPQK